MKDAVELFIIGIDWPPETFLSRKIRWIAHSGIHITIFSSSVGKVSAASGENFSVVPMPKFGTGNYLPQISFPIAVLIKNGLANPVLCIALWQHVTTHFPDQSLLQKLKYFLVRLPFTNKKPDIIHFEWNSSAIGFEDLFDYFDVPVVISCRGSQVQIRPYLPDEASHREGLRSTFRKAAAVHGVSRAILREAEQWGMDPAKGHVITPAVDPDFFHPKTVSTRNDDRYLILTTGTLMWRKGYEYALIAVRELVDRGYNHIYLEIIGGGPEEQRVRYTIFDLGLESHVTLAGRVPPETVRDKLQQADAFILASLSEGISNAVLEAMSCGLPVVSTDCGGMTEAITDGVDGFIVPTRASRQMADKLQHLIDHPDEAARMGERARERVLEAFTLDLQMRKFRALYESLLPASADKEE